MNIITDGTKTYVYKYQVSIARFTCPQCGAVFECQHGEFVYNREFVDPDSSDYTDTEPGTYRRYILWLTCPSCGQYHRSYTHTLNIRKEWVERSKVVNFRKSDIIWGLFEKNNPNPIKTGDYSMTDPFPTGGGVVPPIPTPTPTIDYIYVDDSGLQNISSDGLTITKTVQSNLSNWRATSNNPDWCTITPSSGSDNVNVTIKVESNGAEISRNAVITFAHSSLSSPFKLNISQRAKGTEPTPTPGTGNPVINFNAIITNNTGSSVTLDGRLRFVLGNPDHNGNYYGGYSGYYLRTDNIYFSQSAITLNNGETRTFSNLTWKDADTGCGLGETSPLNPSFLPIYADDGGIAYARNVLMYIGGRSDLTLCQNLNPSIIFKEGYNCNITIGDSGGGGSDVPSGITFVLINNCGREVRLSGKVILNVSKSPTDWTNSTQVNANFHPATSGSSWAYNDIIIPVGGKYTSPAVTTIDGIYMPSVNFMDGTWYFMNQDNGPYGHSIFLYSRIWNTQKNESSGSNHMYWVGTPPQNTKLQNGITINLAITETNSEATLQPVNTGHYVILEEGKTKL